MPRIGRVLMAHGHDAADVALLTSFGPSRLERFTVWTDEVGECSVAGPASMSLDPPKSHARAVHPFQLTQYAPWVSVAATTA